MNKKSFIKEIITIPEDYRLTEETTEVRNQQPVTILRYQKDGAFIYNGPRIIAVFQQDTLVSLKNLTEVPEGKLLAPDRAKEIAKKIFSQTNRSYARQLSFIRIERQQREFVDDTGRTQQFPVLWIKFGHSNGSYNWVTLGPMVNSSKWRSTLAGTISAAAAKLKCGTTMIGYWPVKAKVHN